MSNYHEPVEELSKETREFSRALISLKEEIEAVDWYQQRVDVTSDNELKTILEHNRDEEIEHACMALEWLRLKMPNWDDAMRNYLFKEGDKAYQEHTEDEEKKDELGKLKIGTLK